MLLDRVLLGLRSVAEHLQISWHIPTWVSGTFCMPAPPCLQRKTTAMQCALTRAAEISSTLRSSRLLAFASEDGLQKSYNLFSLVVFSCQLLETLDFVQVSCARDPRKLQAVFSSSRALSHCSQSYNSHSYGSCYALHSEICVILPTCR